MTPELLVFSINSIIRLGKAGKAAAEQAARDQDALFPLLKATDYDPLIYVNSYFRQDTERRALVQGNNAPHKALWDQVQDQAIENDEGINDLLIISIQWETESGGSAPDPRVRTDLAAGSALVAQWNPSNKPVSPWIGVMLTAADIALAYVSTHPEILDIGSQGEKIISAYAKELAVLLPDDGNFGPEHGFGQRLGATFLKAGLSAVVTNPQWLSSEEHVQKLIGNSIKPLIDAFPAQTAVQQLVWSDLGEAIMGPVAAATFETLAANQAAFLGDNFQVDEALGALTNALFVEIAKDGLTDQFKKEGLLELYRAAVTVVVEKPALFVGADAGASDDLARDMVSSLARVLVQVSDSDRQLGRQLAGTAIAVVGRNAQRFADEDEPWHAVAAQLVGSVTASLSTNILSQAAIKNVLSQDQLVELGRIVVTSVGNSPSLVTGADHAEWNGVISAIAQAMEADEKLLLSGDDWLQIASVAAREAATNPERLFKLDVDQVLAGQLMSTLLEAASVALAEPTQAKRSVLYGDTLREALLITVRAASGNAGAVREHLAEIKLLSVSLNTFVIENHEEYGSKEWLRMFRMLLQAVLDGVGAPVLDAEIAEELLKGAV
jgi:hypothetical protein